MYVTCIIYIVKYVAIYIIYELKYELLCVYSEVCI